MAPISTCNRRLIQQSVLRIDSIYTQRILESLHDGTRLSTRNLFNSSSRIHQRYQTSLAFRFHDSISKSWISNPIQIPPLATIDTRKMSTKNTESKEQQPTTTTKPRKVTTLSIAAKKRKQQKITMVTAYDYPSAVHVDRAGMDIVLVGDSCAMVELGFETTQVNSFVFFVHMIAFDCLTSFNISISPLHILATPIAAKANYIRSNDTSLSGSKAWCTESAIINW